MSTVDRYKRMIRDLLPQGRAWNKSPASFMDRLVCTLVDELVRIDGRVEDLLFQTNPNNATELLEDWETLLGLPDECSPSGQTLAQRQEQAYTKLVSTGGQSVAYFKEVAANLGFTIEIKDVFGAFEAGDPCGEPLFGEAWVHWWEVSSTATAFQIFRAGRSSAGDPLRFISNDVLQCTINKLKPAHTKVIFSLAT